MEYEYVTTFPQNGIEQAGPQNRKPQGRLGA
jgi:hypothetical protein